MTVAIIESDAFEHIKLVADQYVKGVTSPYTIARRLNMKVTEVRTALEQWQTIITADAESKDLARDALHTMLERYDRLLVEANENLDNLKSLEYDEKISAQINATLKNIADFDAKRVALLREAGLLDAADLGDELAEREQREAMILDILKNDLCRDCQIKVRDKVSAMTGVVQGTVVETTE
jgi:hypothetical protein